MEKKLKFHFILESAYENKTRMNINMVACVENKLLAMIEVWLTMVDAN